ncbi:Hsp20/alpha crystallin family protein [Sanyastnella coralliicola]|uniref:Hsp20/alpha crystallin family protein n=1 Tax=Sanyastnella coralliicola TaxID=3069118 RepID=UPI0027B97EFB|nr:Hsp20/alpha crystallin family protein [Longitalea sp. SCSIO 12813]
MGLVKYRTGLPTNFNSLFDDFVNDGFLGGRSVNVPSANISEGNDRFSIELQAPGFDKEDFELKLDKQMLTLSATQKEKEESKDVKFTQREFKTSTFKRTFRLPENVDNDGISASYNNGILSVVIPKKEAEKTVKTFTVS